MLPALRELKPDMLNGRLAHGDHPVLLTTARPTRSSTAYMRQVAKCRNNKSAGPIHGPGGATMARRFAGG